MSFKIFKSPEAEEVNKRWKVLGKSQSRADSIKMVTGKSVYVDDVSFPNVLYAKLLHSPVARAKITRIETSKAEALPGVKAIVTYKDAAEIGITQIPPRYWLTDRLFYVGDTVAAVAAEDEAIAEEALDLMEVKYETLPFWITPEEAKEAPPMHPNVAPDNLYVGIYYPYERTVGDVGTGFAEANKTVEAEFRKPNIKHMFSENYSAAALWRGDELHVWTHTQEGSALFAEDLAKIFNMPTNKVHAFQCHIGGGFGGKAGFGPTRLTVIAAMLAKKAGRPVKIRTNICEHFVEGHVLSPGIATSKFKVGAKEEGTLTAIDAKMWSGEGRDTIGIGFTYVGDAVFNTYHIPNRAFKLYPYYSNTIEGGPLRAYGSQVCVQPLEGIMSELAEALGMDPVEFIIKNGFRDGDMFTQYLHFDFQLAGGNLPELVRKSAEEFGWKEKWKGWGKPTAIVGPKRRGVGVASAQHTAWGLPPRNFPKDNVVVKINHHDGTVEWVVGGREMGSGYETAICQVVAEVLGVEFEDVVRAPSYSVGQPIGGSTGGSKGLQSVVFAAHNAAQDVKQRLLTAASKVLDAGLEEIALDLKKKSVYVKAAPEKVVNLTKLSELFSGVLIGVGACASHYEGPECPRDPKTGKRLGMRGIFCSFAEVEVDTETGKVEIVKLMVSSEAGMVLNPKIVYGQTISGAVHGISQMLGEGIIYDEETGTPLNASLVNYPFLTALDVTEEQLASVVMCDPGLARLTPFKAKGLAEGIYAACWGSIGAAIYSAIGVRIREFPFRPERILDALGKAPFPKTKSVI